MVKSDRRKVAFPMWRKRLIVQSSMTMAALFFPHGLLTTLEFVMHLVKGKTTQKIRFQFFSRARSILEHPLQFKPKVEPLHSTDYGFPIELVEELRITYQMTYIRGLEEELQKKNPDSQEGSWDSEKEIPFWEFLDIEYDFENKEMHFTSHWNQKVMFLMVFPRGH